MHTPGFTWYTAPLPSRASSLLQVHLPTCPPTRPVNLISVGAGLPAMLTPGSLTSRASSLLQVHLPTHLASAPSFLWELACQRCLHRDFPDTPHRCHREQARSYRSICPPAHPPGQRTMNTVGAGLPAMLTPGSLPSRASSLLQVRLPTHLASEPSLLWAQGCQPTLARALSRRSGLRENTWLAQPLRSLAASMALRMASSTASAAATNNGEM